MLNPGRGGRGKRAPYNTIHYRIPEPIKPVVEMLADRFRQLIGGGVSDPSGEDLIRRIEVAIAGDLDDDQIPYNFDPRDEHWQDKGVDEDEDLDNDIGPDEYDDDSEPTHAEVEKAQAATNHKLSLGVKMLDREVAELKARLQSADESIFQYQLTSDMTKAKIATARTFLEEFLAKSSRESKAMRGKIEEAFKLVDSI